jgi:NtrC-family two-component system response regulator AlgB
MGKAASIGQSVLVVDDEKNIRTALAIFLQELGCAVSCANDVQGAMDAVHDRRFAVAFVDLKLRGESALDLIPRLVAEDPDLLVVLMTAVATSEEIVAAMRLGAWHYLPKPFTPAGVQHTLIRAIAARARDAGADTDATSPPDADPFSTRR